MSSLENRLNAQFHTNNILAMQHYLDVKMPLKELADRPVYESSYEEVTSRVGKLDKPLGEVSEADIKAVVEASEEYWQPKDPLIHPYKLLAAYKWGKIPHQTYATLSTFWSAYNQYGGSLETVPIFDDDQCQIVNERAELILRLAIESSDFADTFKGTPSLGNYAKEMRKLHLPDTKYLMPDLTRFWNKFIHNLSKLPKVQRQFLIAPDINPNSSAMGQEINKTFSNNFGRYIRKISPKTPLPSIKIGRIIPSVGALQSKLNAQYKDPFTIVFLHGNCTELDLAEFVIKRQWPMQGHLPAAPCPKIADGGTTSPVDFTVNHDGEYHPGTLSVLPHEHCSMWAKLALHFSKSAFCKTEDSKWVIKELTSFDVKYQRRNFTLSQHFWFATASMFDYKYELFYERTLDSLTKGTGTSTMKVMSDVSKTDVAIIHEIVSFIFKERKSNGKIYLAGLYKIVKESRIDSQSPNPKYRLKVHKVLNEMLAVYLALARAPS